MTKIAPKTTKEHIVNIYNKIELLETESYPPLTKRGAKVKLCTMDYWVHGSYSVYCLGA